MSPLASWPLWAQLAAAGGTAGALVALAGPPAAALLARWGHGQQIREDAPGRHHQKAGTPTMGGVLIVGAIGVAALLTAGAHPVARFVVAATATFAGIGLLDDLIAIRRGRNLGLRARERLVLQGLAGVVLGWYASGQPWAGTQVALPFAGSADPGERGYTVLAALLFVGFANAVNLTDGLDGLAAGLVAIAGLGFTALAAVSLQPAAAVTGAAVVAAAAGFLRVNAHPARLFMGDVGSNALGAALAALAVVSKAEVALFIIGGVFVAEAASVILQVAYFKVTGGRRIFRMSPLHHHFELVGWPEPLIVRRFYWAGSACLLAGLLVVAT
ncbi:MAG: phospho-N-acetylmuramoyl-pentapeptide-transferase [Armatimonadota bacterium]|nr:phospho-N-acetylmuramoyl-pentapeptide-transferase [Armatimonadota bacterium]